MEPYTELLEVGVVLRAAFICSFVSSLLSQALVFEHLVALFEEIVELLGDRAWLKKLGY